MRYKDFEIQLINSHKAQIVKWDKDFKHCFVIAFLNYDNKEKDWELTSVGSRYVDYADGTLNKIVSKYMEMLYILTKTKEEEGDIFYDWS